MQYWGKIIGVAVALLMGGGFWGVVLGLLIGHMFDKARSRKMAWFANQRERQALFFATTFEVMGHLTKSKGRVTEADIHIASQLMDRMNLHGASRTAAQNAFRVGKSDLALSVPSDAMANEGNIEWADLDVADINLNYAGGVMHITGSQSK